MEENSIFFKYIFQEDLYIIDEQPPAPKITDENDTKPETDIIGGVQEPESAVYQKVEKPVRQEKISFYGNNEKRLLVLVKDAENDFLNKTDLDFLMKIVEKGIMLSKNDMALVNTSKFAFERIAKEIPFDFLIAFGTGELDRVSGHKLYEITEKKGKKILFADDLFSIRTDESKKRQLWPELKKMFNL